MFRFFKDAAVIKLSGKMYQGGLIFATYIASIRNTYQVRKELSLNQKNNGAAIEKPLFVVQGCLEMP